MTRDEWEAEGQRRFGPDHMAWRFVCPVCKYEQSAQDYKDAGAPSNAIAFSCVGRWMPKAKQAFEDNDTGPCNYAGGGLFRLNPLDVDGSKVFDFADAARNQQGEAK